MADTAQATGVTISYNGDDKPHFSVVVQLTSQAPADHDVAPAEIPTALMARLQAQAPAIEVLVEMGKPLMPSED